MPLEDIPASAFRPGKLRMVEGSAPPTDQVHVVAWLWWGDSSYPLQPGVRLMYRGAVHKVERFNGDMVRLLSQTSRDTRESWIHRSKITSDMHMGKWYQVLSLKNVVKSPRRWGEEPEGRQCLVLETRATPHRARQLQGTELKHMSEAAYSELTQSTLQGVMFSLDLTDDETARLTASAITSHMTI